VAAARTQADMLLTLAILDLAVSAELVRCSLITGSPGEGNQVSSGGGFLLVICSAEHQRSVRESLTGMRELPVKLDRLGSRIVLNVQHDIWC
jgi:D-glycero-alpha-D-manno-heptose-7-phosphate kinase